MDTKKVMIGIQARSTSKRFPGKIGQKLGRTTVLGSVLYASKGAAYYINDRWDNLGVKCSVALLIPRGDVIRDTFYGNYILEGPEDDVLTRYKMLADDSNADFFVRVTSDCPMLQSHAITKVIMTGVREGYDYLANFFESKGDRKLFRLVPDGFECEFFSRKMLEWAHAEAKEPKDREHVTTIMRTYPEWGKFGVILPFENRENEKLSVDTETDLEVVRKNVERVDETKAMAEKMFGKSGVHRH